MNRYSISSDSHRWWWTSALAGTAAAALVAGLVTASSSTATPVTGAPGISEGFAADANRCPPAPNPVYVGAPWVPPVPTGCSTLDKWWKYVDLPHAGRGPSEGTRGRAHCPRPPDPVYVGAPWVPPVPTGCSSVDRWWKYVDLPE